MITINATGDEDDFPDAAGVVVAVVGALAGLVDADDDTGSDDGGAELDDPGVHVGNAGACLSRIDCHTPGVGGLVATEPNGFSHTVGTFAVNAAYASGTPNP